jgi:hypothetical protein
MNKLAKRIELGLGLGVQVSWGPLTLFACLYTFFAGLRDTSPYLCLPNLGIEGAKSPVR